jgi:hypothetical protein
MTAIAGIQQFGRSLDGEALYYGICQSVILYLLPTSKETENVTHIQKNRAVLKFKDKELCGYRVWILF